MNDSAPDLLMCVYDAYRGSNGDVTTALYDQLERRGPIGFVAANLFRACKNSERAKKYRGRKFRGAAYDRKQWAIGNLCRSLSEHAKAIDLGWGWGEDRRTIGFEWVLYVDLPTGQVSFHTSHRGDGPDYPGKWDGHNAKGADRIIRFCATVLSREPL